MSAARLLFFTLAVAAFFAGCQAPVATPPVAETPAAPVPPPPVPNGRDAFVVLSGGGTPTSNNYSQFIQARALAAHLRAQHAPDSVWVFFGVGNRTGEPAVLADVYQQIKHEGLLLDTWLPGALPDNLPATKDSFLRTLRAEILPRVRDGGTLYLFVGDHGELTRGKEPQSAITMWGLAPDSTRPNGWATARDYALTVSELRQALAAGIGRGRVVFAMTQCHSGGFHELGVAREMQPPASWFVNAPRWLSSTTVTLPPVAGFTATDQESIAAGCDPSPDPETWLGYERFFPEQLLGRDLLSGATRGPTRFPLSFAAAHDAAVLIDQTLDRPRSTSEHYLERWAALIETRLARELLLTPATREAVTAFQRAVDTGRFSARDATWLDAHAKHLARLDRLTTQNPAARRTLVSGNRRDLEQAAGSPREADNDASDEDAGPSGLTRAQSRAWREVLRPAWIKAVAAREVAAVPAAALAFEERLQQIDTRGRPPGFTDEWPTRALNELFWASTHAVPQQRNQETAAAVLRWAATRRTAILAWADAAGDPAVREAAQQFGAEFRRPRVAPARSAAPAIAADVAATRVLLQRRVLAAWEFLLALKHEPALQELRRLQELERTPLPMPAS